MIIIFIYPGYSIQVTNHSNMQHDLNEKPDPLSHMLHKIKALFKLKSLKIPTVQNSFSMQ